MTYRRPAPSEPNSAPLVAADRCAHTWVPCWNPASDWYGAGYFSEQCHGCGSRS